MLRLHMVNVQNTNYGAQTLSLSQLWIVLQPMEDILVQQSYLKGSNKMNRRGLMLTLKYRRDSNIFVSLMILTCDRIELSDNGWTSDFHCYQWFKDTFILQTTEQNTSGKPILLIYDGHGSHEKYELLRLAKEHKIILFSLPPHTTHKLQPLDVRIFGPFACAWTERCNDYMEEHLEEIPRDQFIKYYMEVRQNTFKAITIHAAF